MISGARVQKLFSYLLPMLGDKSKAELDKIYADIEKILGFDAKKAARLRQDAKQRDSVMDALMGFRLAQARASSGGVTKKKTAAQRMSMPQRTLNKL